MTVAEDKRRWREHMRAARAALSAEDRRAASASVAATTLALLAAHPPGIVGGYLAIGDELDAEPTLRALGARGWQVCLPVMQGPHAPLRFAGYRFGDPLVKRTWGIREPLADGGWLTPAVLLVPLLAFDAAGHRLGYGGGYYDRTLAASVGSGARPLAIGLAFDAQQLSAVPVLDGDEKLDHIVTSTLVVTPTALRF